MKKVYKEKIQSLFRKLSGGNKLQEQIDTLYYFLNNYTDIKNLESTTNEDLRNLQLCCVELLAIFDKACEKYGLRYWLDYGTLLGCIRHNGFIPWDDDMDVAMPREDYDRLITLLKDDMDKYGIIVRWGGYYDDRGPMERLAIAYKTLQTGAWLDVFPVDHIDTSCKADEIKDEISKKSIQYNKIYRKKNKKYGIEKFVELKRKIFGSFAKGENKVYFHGQEFDGCDDFVMDESDIFPLEKHKFENYEFNVPKRYDLYLSALYDEDYMSYPKSGVEHHLDPDGSKASTRAKRSGTNMDDEICYLRNVLKEYTGCS